jgi:IS6 family transposase
MNLEETRFRFKKLKIHAYRFIKKLVRPMLGFQSFRTATRTLKGIETMHMIKKGQIKSIGTSVSEKVNFIHNLFHLTA